jgi:putative ATP-dependent endonuclease of the OLD family
VHLKKIVLKNFRLLHEAALFLEKQTTVIVGRNNSGKTSLTEVMTRLLAEGNPTFRLEDFSCAAHHCFWDAYLAKVAGTPVNEVRPMLPAIEVRLSFEYGTDEQLGTLTDFVLDFDVDCTEALVVISYEIEAGRIDDLFNELTGTDEAIRPAFYRALRERIPALYAARIAAVDPNDETNQRSISASALRAACANNCINAQRGLDDISQKERVVIGRVLEKLFTTAKANEADAAGHTLAEELEQAVLEIQEKIGVDFNAKLNELLPALSLFGYPGLPDPHLLTETTLDVERLLTNHTKVRYSGSNGINLPESYNGLGARNIILILLLLRQYFKDFIALDPKPAAHLIFIEEPEVHLHPQMQEVFIRKLGEIADEFSTEIASPWPVQFVVSTHSSHIANEAHFETIRYFMAAPDDGTGELKSVVKDLRYGLAGKPQPSRDFLHQYLTLTRCDLFFADKAILIEGTTERILMPRIIEILDKTQQADQKLGTQYLSVVEVGGAYAQHFFDLIEFLELRTLIICDIDSTAMNANSRYTACAVHAGTRSSNSCINTWLPNGGTVLTPVQLTLVPDDQKIAGHRRIAYQVPEIAGGPCGRSFEDAYMLANTAMFPMTATAANALELEAGDMAGDVKKSNFALEHAISDTDWIIPRYIREGLVWLAAEDAMGVNAAPAPGVPNA